MKRIMVSFLLLFVLTISGFPLDPVEMFHKPWEELTRRERREFRRLITIQTYEPSGKPGKEKLEHYIQIFKSKNVFDPKVAVFNVTAGEKGSTITLMGEVLFPNHKRGIERTLSILGFDRVENNIRVLPDPSLGEYGFAVVESPVLSVKRNPQLQSEQMNQVLKGGSLRLLKSDATGKFFLVQCPDAYVGWVDARDIKRMTLKEWAQYRKDPRDDKASREKILAIAKPIMGIPYIWGGITIEGMDCSGLTQYIYMERGINLPRDADEQSNLGELVAFPGYEQNLRAGDLLFYSGGSGRISHVSISLGGSDYLQSVGRNGVHLSSFDPESPNYDERTNEKFIFARRLLRDGF